MKSSKMPERKHERKKPRGKPALARPLLRVAALLVCALLLVPIAQVAVVRFVNPPTSVPMLLARLRAEPSAVRYEWTNLDEMPLRFLKHCLVAEDQRFFQHRGFDWREIDAARTEAAHTGRPARGASTITMQCARSLFLWQGRSWVRKALEAYYTLLMEMLLSKQRILELYANVIELGDGIYGIAAGSKHHFHVSPRKLTREQSAMLAALLPNPKARDPAAPSRILEARQRMILKREQSCVLPAPILRSLRR